MGIALNGYHNLKLKLKDSVPQTARLTNESETVPLKEIYIYIYTPLTFKNYTSQTLLFTQWCLSIRNCGSESKRMDNNTLPLIWSEYYRKREREKDRKSEIKMNKQYLISVQPRDVTDFPGKLFCNAR